MSNKGFLWGLQNQKERQTVAEHRQRFAPTFVQLRYGMFPQKEILWMLVSIVSIFGSMILDFAPLAKLSACAPSPNFPGLPQNLSL